jgi:hypothetical protein
MGEAPIPGAVVVVVEVEFLLYVHSVPAAPARLARVGGELGDQAAP